MAAVSSRFPPPYAVDVALSTRSHERIGHRRADEAWLADRWRDPATRVLVLSGGRFPLTDDNAVRWLSPQDAPEGQRLLLGEVDGAVHLAVLASDLRAPEDWGDLRRVGPLLAPQDQSLIVQAQAMAEWHRAHRYCGRCGGSLEVTGGGYQLRCTGSCQRSHFPRTDPAVIMLVTDGGSGPGERALLGRQRSWPPGRYSTLAGFVDPGESLEQAVVREVREEAGVEVTDVTYFGNQPWPFPASLMVGFYARAVTTDITVDADEIESARWFSRADLAAETAAGTLVLPSGISISRSLVEAWYGAPLPGHW